MTATQQGTLLVSLFDLEAMKWAKLTNQVAPFYTNETLGDLIPEDFKRRLGPNFSKFFQGKSFTGTVTSISDSFPYSVDGTIMPRDNDSNLCVESPIPFTAKSGDDEGIMHLTFEGA